MIASHLQCAATGIYARCVSTWHSAADTKSAKDMNIQLKKKIIAMNLYAAQIACPSWPYSWIHLLATEEEIELFR
jgi:hypothetical protein